MMMRVLLFLTPLYLATVLACTTTGAARGGVSERTVEIDGQVVRVEDAAKADYDRAVQLREAGDLAAAKELLEKVRREYKDASFADHATVALAQIHLDEKDPKRAQSLLESLLLEDPTSPAAEQARFVLALAQLAQGDTASAAPALDRAVDKLESDDEKREAALKLAAGLESQGQRGEAARYLARALELTRDDDARAEIEGRLFDIIDSSVSFTDVRRLKEVEAKPGTFLDELLTFKLARVHVHLRDYVAASDAAETYLESYPSGRFAAEASALKERLEARVAVEQKAIGVVLPLSGTYKNYGQRALTAIKLGMGLKVDRDAYKGDDTGRLSFSSDKLKLIVRDSKGDPTFAAHLVEELIEKDHVIAIVGDILLNTSLPVALKAEEYGVPILSLSRREGVAQLGPWTFRVSFTAQKQAQALAQLAMDELGMKRFGILYPRHSYGIELMNAFWDEVEKRKGEVTAIESYSHDQTTFTEEAKRLVGRLHLEARGEYIVCKAKAKQEESAYQRKKALERCTDDVTPIVDFEALIIPDDYRTVSYIVPALVAEDILVTKDKYITKAYRKTTENSRVRAVQLLGGAMWNDPELGERLGRQIEGAVLVDGFSPRDGTDKVSRFVEGFSDIHRSEPTLMEAQAYDAGHLLFAILNGQAGAAPQSREQMRETLASVKDFPGVTGLVRFDEEGDSSTPPRFFMLEKGRIEPADIEAIKNPGEG